MIGKISYGAVELSIVKVTDMVRQPIMSEDGVDYLYTHVSIDCTCVLNPAATSFATLEGSVPTAGAAFAGRTDRILFDYLSQPRRQLTMWAYDTNGTTVVYLQSPNSGDGGLNAPLSDAKNGPFVEVSAIHGADVHGVRTWILHLRFTTFINNCTDGDSPILSHRWTSSADIDEQGRTIVVRRGTVVFNVGRLWEAEQSPDYYRATFFIPPPPSFFREHINVEIAPDNCTAAYTVIDGERFYNLGSKSPAVKVEGNLSISNEQGTALAALPAAAQAMGGQGGGFWQGVWDGMNPLGRAARAAGGVAASYITQLPRKKITCKVRAFGARDSDRGDLAALCMAIAYSRMQIAPNFWAKANRIGITISQSLEDNVVDLDMWATWMEQTWDAIAGGIAGPAGAIAFAAGQFFGGNFLPLLVGNDPTMTWLFSFFKSTDPAGRDASGNNTYARRTIPGFVNVGDPLLSNDPTVGNRPLNKAFPAEGNTRGVGYMKYLITQGLMGECGVPEVPPVWDADYDGAKNVVPKNPQPLLPAGGPAAAPAGAAAEPAAP